MHIEPWREDAVTVNPYLGTDGIAPFTEECRDGGKGLFILVRTSNPSSSELQELELADGRKLFEAVADLTVEWGRECMGSYGYSEVGAVIGATHREQGEALRIRMPHCFFLVPGYGAQGASGKDLKAFFNADGKGAIVNSSRGIIAAYQNEKYAKFGEANYAQASRQAVLDMIDDIRGAIG